MQKGFTLVEAMIVLAVVGVLTALATPRVAGWMDRLAVMRSVQGFQTFYNAARMGAVYQSSRVRVSITPDSLVAVSEGDPDSVIVRLHGPATYGVSLQVSRRVIRLYPTGIGLGAANTTVVLQRGAIVESLTISRLGRLRGR
jgi:type IV fimbrial biogenesis protein FimT